ncbi:hypothetical protein [Nonomuraea salmonea]|uniref:hypothetical protein n=1 Tax=Nonomuraea salmonea TaxID=46181 RepID=UPI0031E6FC36
MLPWTVATPVSRVSGVKIVDTSEPGRLGGAQRVPVEQRQQVDRGLAAAPVRTPFRA